MKFGDNLKLIRKQRKISQEQLAEKVGVSRQSVSKWETSEAYPEMNNILQLCKIFNCHINDLVHEDMSDIDSLDEEVKMNVVKFKKQEQKRMKLISKSIYIISKIGSIISKVVAVLIFLLMFVAPFIVNKITINTESITILSQEINMTEQLQDLEKARTIFENNTTLTLIIYMEIILLCLALCMVILAKLFTHIKKLFENIHNGQTPFTLENVEYVKNIAKTLILFIIFPIVTATIMEFIMGVDLGVEFKLMDVILVLITISMSYIFEYGYQIQNDSKGVMYDEK